MRRTLKTLIAALLAALFGNSTFAADLKPGDPAPNFSMTGSDGKTHSLAGYKGKQAVVIAWFPKAFTGGCTAECKSMRENGEAIRKFDVAYFTASCDTPEKNNEFADSLGLDYPILSRPDQGKRHSLWRTRSQGQRHALDVLHRQGWQDPGHRQRA